MKSIQLIGYDKILIVETVELIEKELGGSSLYKKGKQILRSYCGERYYHYDKEKLRLVLKHLHNLKQAIRKLRQVTQLKKEG
jgi:hypothetical protein